MIYRRTLLSAVSAHAVLVLALLASYIVPAHADPLQNAYDERQGNYDFQLKTNPKNPVEHSPTEITIRLGSVDGTDLVDIPITVRIVDSDGNTVLKTNPTVITGGHYTLDYTFDKPGRYAIYADINDYTYSGQTLTFTFLVNVVSVFDFLYIVIPVGIAGMAGFFILGRLKKRKSAFKIDKL